jgi:Fe-S cluster biogenesis protein NfuA
LEEKVIFEILDEVVTPVIAVDGGEIELVSLDEQNRCVRVRFGGSYTGSPARGIVLKYLVEPVLKDRVKDLTAVEMVD